MAIGQLEKPQLDLFEKKAGETGRKETGMKNEKYKNPFHDDFEMSKLGIDGADRLEGEEHKLLLDKVLHAAGEARKEDDKKDFEVSIALISEVSYGISKLRGVKEFSHEEFMEVVRQIVKTLDGYKFASGVFSLLKKKARSAEDAFGNAQKEKPKFGIEKSLPKGDQDEETE